MGYYRAYVGSCVRQKSKKYIWGFSKSSNCYGREENKGTYIINIASSSALRNAMNYMKYQSREFME